MFKIILVEPTKPRDLHLTSSSTTSLSVAWLEPNPANGQLTGYTVEAWTEERKHAPLRNQIDRNIRRWTADNLRPNTTYGIRVSTGNYTCLEHFNGQFLKKVAVSQIHCWLQSCFSIRLSNMII